MTLEFNNTQIEIDFNNIKMSIRRLFSPSAFRVMKNNRTGKYIPQFKMYGLWWRFGKKEYTTVDELDRFLMKAKSNIKDYILGRPRYTEVAVISILDEEE